MPSQPGTLLLPAGQSWWFGKPNLSRTKLTLFVRPTSLCEPDREIKRASLLVIHQTSTKEQKKQSSCPKNPIL
jgi:hypothetical protein